MLTGRTAPADTSCLCMTRAAAVAAVIAAAVVAVPAAALAGPAKDAGAPVLLGKRTKASHCRLGVLPGSRCSPGAYATKLTQQVVCGKGFRTSEYRNVTQSTKRAVEAAYGMKARSYGKALEIDHIVSLELGGSNDAANLFPELAKPLPGYHEKDRLENRLHDVVCTDHAMTLRQAQRAIARDWRRLYAKVFGVEP
jgi:hypothetical protein